ncbi:MAG TPA: hypothetical protein VGC84_15440 [Ilumatobacteraceae bacterium]
MIDNDLSRQLHSLASTVDESFDLVSLRRRITMHNRRRAVARTGVAGASVAAVLGGLVVVRDQRPDDSGLAASTAETTTAAPPARALPDCATVLADLRAPVETPDAAIAKKNAATAASEGGDGAVTVGFKAVVTILTIDGPTLTFSSDHPEVPMRTPDAATVEAATVWVDGTTPLEPPPALHVGQKVGIATTVGSDGADHVVFVDIADRSNADPNDAKPEAGATESQKDTTDLVPSPDTKPVAGNPAPGPTAKSTGTITSVGGTSIEVTVHPEPGPDLTFAVDIAGTVFYAGNTVCAPTALTVGAPIGVAYHFDDAGTVVADDVLLLP